jgi:hypothetical protein
MVAACSPSEPAPSEEPTPEAAEAEAEAPAEEAAAAEEAAPEAAAPAAEADAPAADTFEGGVLTSPRFNIQLRVPESWTMAANAGPAGLGTSEDSLTLTGPGEDGLRLVIANSESIQLVDASFANLTETVGFENVRIHPDRSQTRTFNGVAGYRTEADALLRGDRVPVYIVAQALELPGKPTMATLFVNGDKYDIHAETMFAVLDSIEPLNLRGE